MPLAPCRLLAEWPDGAGRPAKYFLRTTPAGTSRKRLVATAKGRWWVGHGYRERKDELGLDHFEGRVWHHRVAVVPSADAFLRDVRRRRPR